MIPGRVIILNGASSAGKTTIARAWQAANAEPWLRVGIDQFWSMAPAGVLDGDVADPWFPRDEPRSASIVGVAFTRAWHRAVAALAHDGFHVIVDDVCFLPSFVSDWRDALRGLDVLWVAVHCPVAIIAERELDRGDRFRSPPWRTAPPAPVRGPIIRSSPSTLPLPRRRSRR